MLLHSTIATSSTDALFKTWCTSVGIAAPCVEVETTPLSFAGRGVFASEPLTDGQVAISIPERCVLHPKNGATYFPKVAQTLRQRRRRNEGGWLGRVRRRRWMRRDNDEPECWQAELTAYALAALDTDHPWASWISQWQRDDTVQRLFESGVKWDDEVVIEAAADELQQALLPTDVPIEKLRAMLQMRLATFEQHKKVYFDGHDESVGGLYATLCSRAIELGEGIVGVIPMYDMVNHSLDPNLALSFDGNNFELFALRDIDAGEELFVCYTKLGEALDEDKACWALVQWGIPSQAEV